MAVIKRFNFMAAGRPTMQLDLPGMSLELYEPTKNTLERFLDAHEKLLVALEDYAKGKIGDDFESEKTIRDIYGMAAELISINTENVTVTAEDLANKFGLSLESLVLFYEAYTDFLNQIINSKN